MMFCLGDTRLLAIVDAKKALIRAASTKNDNCSLQELKNPNDLQIYLLLDTILVVSDYLSYP